MKQSRCILPPKKSGLGDQYECEVTLLLYGTTLILHNYYSASDETSLWSTGTCCAGGSIPLLCSYVASWGHRWASHASAWPGSHCCKTIWGIVAKAMYRIATTFVNEPNQRTIWQFTISEIVMSYMCRMVLIACQSALSSCMTMLYITPYALSC